MGITSQSAPIFPIIMDKGKPHQNPGLLDLLVEILLYILQAANSLSDLKSLILAAPSFNNVWKAYTASISLGVLGRTIEGFDQVLKLEETVHPKLAAGFEPAIQRLKRITSAARLASCAYEDYIFNFSHNSVYRELFPAFDSGQEEFCLRDPESRRSFKRSFYWLWMLVVTSEYKPLVLHQPLDPFPLRRSDVLTLCELSGWIVDGVFPPPFSIFSKAYRIYKRKDRVRCAQNRRWQLCCISLWQQIRFRQVRRDHWSLDLGMIVSEPFYEAPNAYGHHALHVFMANARKAQSSIYQARKQEEV